MTTATKAPSRAQHKDAPFDAVTEPTDEAFRLALGLAFNPLKQVLAWLEAEHAGFRVEWKYAPLSGWYQVYVLKKRRLFYLIPRRNGFRLVILLGDRAITVLRQGPLSGGVDSLLEGAKRYPEGTAFTLESEGFYPEVAISLLTAKLAA